MALTNFGFVTVMDIKVYEGTIFATGEEANGYTYGEVAFDAYGDGTLPAADVLTVLATIDSLSISNISQEGPRKEARGGLYAQPKVRYGKTMRLEMEDVLVNSEALDALGAANVTAGVITMDETFQTHKVLVGKTFVVNKATGDREWTYVVFPRFLPDSIFDLTMESEGDIGVMSLAGELFADADDKFFVLDVTPTAKV